MDRDLSVTEGCVPTDPMDKVGHLLIRAYNGDTFDPFFVQGHPNMRQGPNRLVRACFYYLVAMGPKVTLLLDNYGRGGMCDVVPEEIAAIWRTEEILTSLGTTFEALRDGSAVILTVELPKPFWSVDDEVDAKNGASVDQEQGAVLTV